MPSFGVCGENDFDPTVGPPGAGNFNSTPFLVAYGAVNPNAQYIVAGPGALATGSRNTLATQPTNDFSLATYKDISIITSFLTGPNSTSYLNYLTPGNAIFNNPKAVFASNARSIALVAKFTF